MLQMSQYRPELSARIKRTYNVAGINSREALHDCFVLVKQICQYALLTALHRSYKLSERNLAVSYYSFRWTLKTSISTRQAHVHRLGSISAINQHSFPGSSLCHYALIPKSVYRVARCADRQVRPGCTYLDHSRV